MYRVLGIEKHLMCVYTTKYDKRKWGIFKMLRLTKNIQWLQSDVQNRNLSTGAVGTLISSFTKPNFLGQLPLLNK